MFSKDYSVGWVIAETWPYRNVMASTRIRCFDIIDYLRNNGIKTGLYSSFKKYDIVVFQKTFNKNNYRTARKLESQGTRIILDINVNYFEKQGEARQVTEKHIEDLQSFLKLTDSIIVSSPNLRETAQKYHSDVHYIPEHLSTTGSHPPKVISNPVKLVYCGYSEKANSLMLIEKALGKLSENYDLELTFICDKNPRLKLPIKTSFMKYDQNNLAGILRQGDIKVAPRKLDNTYDLGHSFTKIGYPISVGLPVVASPVPSYYGSPALIAKSQEDWFKHISFLINNPEEYTKLSKEGILFAKEHFSLDKIGPMYLDFFKRMAHE